MAGYKQRLKRSWKFFVAVCAPLLLLPVLFASDDHLIPVPDKDYKAFGITTTDAEVRSEDGAQLKESPKFKLAYVILVMAVYWSLEIIPLPVTSLFPLVMFPLFGIDDAASVSKSYMKESNTIFLGGAIVALAVEYCNLHRRVALRLIMIVGVSPKRLMFGIMTVVSFLSMWISSTTCVTIIVPIIVAIVDEIHEVSDATIADYNINQNENQGGINNDQPPTHQLYSPSIRHGSVFANRALSSPHQNHHTSVADNSQRSTFGCLEGHRSSKRGNQSPDNHRSHHNLEENNNFRNNVTTEPLQLSIIKNELNSERILQPLSPPLPHTLINGLDSPKNKPHTEFSFSFSPSKNTSRRTSISSLVQPAKIIGTMIDLPYSSMPSDSDEFQDELERKQLVEKEKWRRIKNMYLFALAYAANIGGTATITGTGPNKVFKEVIKPYSRDISQNGKYVGITFFTWMALNLPPMLINIGVAWCYLTFKYCGLPKLRSKPADKAENSLKRWKEQQVRHYIWEEYKKLGKMTFHEIGVAIIFLLVVFLWILRDPQFFQGWDEAISDAQTGDSTAALLGAVLLFIIPKSWGFLTSKDGAVLEALLDWKFVTQKLPWGVLLLLGSGYAIGDSAARTGLTQWIGKELYYLHDLPEPLLLLIVMLITALITEVVSNTAAASVILPLLLGISREMGTHPLYLSVGAAVTASYAFMLPVASPVNAIVFAAGDFSIWEMITNGYILNVICVFVFYLNLLTLGEHMFHYSQFSYPSPSTPFTNETISSTTASTFNTFFNSTNTTSF